MSFENFQPQAIEDAENTEQELEKGFSPETALSTIKNHGLTLTGLYIKGLNKTLTAEDIKSGTYNDINGVILANIAGEIIALPSNDSTKKWTEQSGLLYDENVSVPHLNEADIWGNEEERNQNSGFKQWLEIHSKLRS